MPQHTAQIIRELFSSPQQEEARISGYVARAARQFHATPGSTLGAEDELQLALGRVFDNLDVGPHAELDVMGPRSTAFTEHCARAMATMATEQAGSKEFAEWLYDEEAPYYLVSINDPLVLARVWDRRDPSPEAIAETFASAPEGHRAWQMVAARVDEQVREGLELYIGAAIQVAEKFFAEIEQQNTSAPMRKSGPR